MTMIRATVAGIVACAIGATAALAEPKTNMLHQWSEGSDAAAIAKLGDMFTAAGGKWEQTSIAGHTANTLAKLRADVVAGNAPPAVQLKGPEIAEWNATGMTANLDELATGLFAILELVGAELLDQCVDALAVLLAKRGLAQKGHQARPVGPDPGGAKPSGR